MCNLILVWFLRFCWDFTLKHHSYWIVGYSLTKWLMLIIFIVLSCLLHKRIWLNPILLKATTPWLRIDYITWVDRGLNGPNKFIRGKDLVIWLIAAFCCLIWPIWAYHSFRDFHSPLNRIVVAAFILASLFIHGCGTKVMVWIFNYLLILHLSMLFWKLPLKITIRDLFLFFLGFFLGLLLLGDIAQILVESLFPETHFQILLCNGRDGVIDLFWLPVYVFLL